jgi:membrane protein YqaA with SNARE-associated domain
MKRSFFRRLYDWMLEASRHPHASWYLGVISAAESSVFPIPPDVMLAPMTLARPERAWFYATLTTLTSVAGGALGYAIGYFVLDAVLPSLERFGYMGAYETIVGLFAAYGVWIVIIKGLTPIPYKIITIAAGAAAMPFVPFLFASVIGRGIRFYTVAGLVKTFGPTVEQKLIRYIDAIGWGIVLLIVGIVLWFRVT